MAGLLARIGGLGLVAATLALGAGCSRSASMQGGNSGAQVNDQKVPFRQDGDPDGLSPISSQMEQKAKAGDELPFTGPAPRTLPSGTLLTVKLKRSLSSAEAHAGDRFSAVIDEPIITGGNVIIGRGTEVSGRIESAQASPLTHSSNSLRLVLDTIMIGGTRLPLHTASLFAREASLEARNLPVVSTEAGSGVRLKKGRRLTFRLTEAVSWGS